MNENDERVFVLNEKISNCILIFLLLVRLTDRELAIWLFNGNPPDWALYGYNNIAYLLTSAILWLNRHRLAKINIDRPFVFVLILGGVLSALRTTPNHISLLSGVAAGFIFWAYIKNFFIFSSPVSYPKGTGLLILLSMLLALVPVLSFGLQLIPLLNFKTLIAVFVGSMQFFLYTIVFEEVIFRGALWSFLRNFGIGEKVAFFVQVLLFWFAHHGSLLRDKEFFFWLIAPCISILLGLLAMRSKSLTPSTIGHFLFNFVSQFLIITIS